MPMIIAALFGLVALIAGVNAIYVYGVHSGKAGCEAEHSIQQQKTSQKVKKAYDKIDQAIPNAGDTDAVDQFLLNHTRGGN